jgi:hypothetical protein
MFSKTPIQDIQLAKVRKTVKLVDSNGQAVSVSSGELYLPFGASCWENKRTDFDDYSVQCYVNKSEQFESYCQELSDKIESLCADSLFDSSSVFTPMLKQNKDFPQLLKINLPRDRYGNFDFVVFDQDSNKVMITEDNVNEIFCKKRTFKCIMECARIWEFNGKIGSVWNAVQVKYYDTPVNDEVSIDSVDESAAPQVSSVYTECML